MNLKPQFEIAYLIWSGNIVSYGDGKIQTDYDFFSTANVISPLNSLNKPTSINLLHGRLYQTKKRAVKDIYIRMSPNISILKSNDNSR